MDSLGDLNTKLVALHKLLDSKKFNYTSEADLQRQLACVLSNAGVPFVREYSLDSKSRLDFFCYDSIAIEVKIGKSLSSLTHQVYKYTQDSKVAAVLVVSTRLQLRRMPYEVNNKPVRVCVLLGSIF